MKLRIILETSTIILFIFFVSYLEQLSNTLQAKGSPKKKAFLEQLLNSDTIVKLQNNKKLLSSIRGVQETRLYPTCCHPIQQLW